MAQVKVFGLGGLGSPCCCSHACAPVTICTKNCSNAAFAGQNVSISGGGGSGVTTTPLGCVNLSIPSAGTYTVSASGSDGSWIPVSTSLACGGSFTFGHCCITLRLSGFCAQDYGCDVDVTLKLNGNPILTTTIPAGTPNFTIYNLPTTSSYSIDVAPNGLPSFTQSIGSISCGQNVDINLLAGLVQPGTLTSPIGFLTDAQGTWPVIGFVYGSTLNASACYSLSGAMGAPYCGINTTTPIRYILNFCNNGGTATQVDVIRCWSVSSAGGTAHFEGPIASGGCATATCTGGACPGGGLDGGNYTSWDLVTYDNCDGSFTAGLGNTNSGPAGFVVPDPVGGGASFVLA